MALFEGREFRLRDEELEPRVAQAEAFLRQCRDSNARLRDAAAPADDEEIATALLHFVGAWPNASHGDLAAYGAQLTQDVIERQPCRYALAEGLRHLRHTSKFLPSIAEVLAALDRMQTRVRNSVWHVEQIEKLLAETNSVRRTP